METIESILAQVENLLQKTHRREAEERLNSLLLTIGEDELRRWEYDIRLVIDAFLPKRRRSLLAVLAERLGGDKGGGNVAADSPLVRQVPQKEPDCTELGVDFRAELLDLSARHIFQWSTFYRDCLFNFFDRFLRVALYSVTTASEIGGVARRELSAHSHEIFGKGFQYVRTQSKENHQYAVAKSLSGLQRFLELPIEFYSARLLTGPELLVAQVLRQQASAWLCGILQGYCELRLDHEEGAAILPRYPRAWAHYLAFLVEDDLNRLLDSLAGGVFRDGVRRSVVPLVRGLDRMINEASAHAPMPALGQFWWEGRRLDVSLRPPAYVEQPQLLEIQAYLDSSLVSPESLREAARRDVSVVLAPIRPELASLIGNDQRLHRIIVSVTEDPGEVAVSSRRFCEALEYAVYSRRSLRAGAAPLTYNFAREFPLQNPFLTKYYHVHRSSVRELLRTFEKRNGVRLWCSVRRSGKTTACFDLGSSTGTSVVVSQTCDSTTQLAEANRFYVGVSAALEGSYTLAADFFQGLVLAASPGKTAGAERFVFVLDEYETLFGRLRTAAVRNEELRYTVVQPLLNQMVAFSRDNLLVFLGQRPTAHFILMDQNQLSAYVQQDSFPLFRHEPGQADGEFAELVRRVLTEHVEVETSFIDGLFAETAGHPFLTVKMLIVLVDWLIDQQRAVRALRLTDEDFAAFAAAKLRQGEISLNAEYAFFREAIGEAIGTYGLRSEPWLYCIYGALKRIALEDGGAIACSKADFETAISELGAEALGFTADYLLSTGAQANFFEYDRVHETVRAKIRLLGRIAGVSRGRVEA